MTDLRGQRLYVSDPVAGKTHDVEALRQSGILDHVVSANLIGDKGYVGLDVITPIKKPFNRDVVDWEKEFNTQINRIRNVVEQAVANFKTWRILLTDYRRPKATFPQAINVVNALDAYRGF